MSRILASDTPIKVLVLNSGVYSNTGGQASTALTGQDSDLARFGSAHDGKHESAKPAGRSRPSTERLRLLDEHRSRGTSSRARWSS